MVIELGDSFFGGCEVLEGSGFVRMRRWGVVEVTWRSCRVEVGNF